MKKLSDYRIREQNGKFYIEKQITETFGLFKKKTVTEWFSVDKWGYCRIPINSEFFNGRMVLIEDHSKKFDTLEEAKEQIIKWCEEPKYHYLVGCCGKYDTKPIPPMNIPYSIAMSAISRELPGWYVVGKTEHKIKEENGGIITFYSSKSKFENAKQKHKEFLEKKEKERKLEEAIKKAQEIADAAIKIINEFCESRKVGMYSKMNKDDRKCRILVFKHILNDAKQYASKKHVSLAEGLFEVLKERKMHIQQEV